MKLSDCLLLLKYIYGFHVEMFMRNRKLRPLAAALYASIGQYAYLQSIHLIGLTTVSPEVLAAMNIKV
jgi:hypothetical protein